MKKVSSSASATSASSTSTGSTVIAGVTWGTNPNAGSEWRSGYLKMMPGHAMLACHSHTTLGTFQCPANLLSQIRGHQSSGSKIDKHQWYSMVFCSHEHPAFNLQKRCTKSSSCTAARAATFSSARLSNEKGSTGGPESSGQYFGDLLCRAQAHASAASKKWLPRFDDSPASPTHISTIVFLRGVEAERNSFAQV